MQSERLATQMRNAYMMEYSIVRISDFARFSVSGKLNIMLNWKEMNIFYRGENKYLPGSMFAPPYLELSANRPWTHENQLIKVV